MEDVGICICLAVYMEVVLKVHVRVFNCQGRRFQHEIPPKFFSEFAEVHYFLAKDLAKHLNMRPLRKINVGFAKDSRKYFLFARK